MSAKTILLIDDEADLQQLVKITLKTRDYNVVVAGNGLEGLEILKTVSPDLIILDMNMPKMGGLEFYQNICVNGMPKFPVLVLTARANMEQLFKELNIDGFLAKPFEIDELLEEVDAIMQKRADAGVRRMPSGKRETRNICIVENDADVLSQIGSVLLGAGFTVNPAQNGTEGIERIAQSIPDVALIKLGLVDIAGDMVILKLKNMARTQDIKYVLYTYKSPEKVQIAARIGTKGSIDRFVECSSPERLLDAVRDLLK